MIAPQISVIIPTRNRAAILRIALRHLAAQTLEKALFEIVIVDDASDDETPTIASEDHGVRLVYDRLPVRRAAASARNRAIALARGPLLVFLDDDSFVRPDFLEAYREAHRRFPRDILTGPIVEISDPAQVEIGRTGAMQGWHRNPFPSGNAAIARAELEAIGGFDEDFDHYGWEDPELYQRLALRKLHPRFLPAATIFHYKPDTIRRDFVARLRLEQQRGAMGALFYAKHRLFSVGWQTKAHPMIRVLDAVLDPLLRLEDKAAATLASGVAPSSSLMRLLVVNHVEINAARKAWHALGPERRRVLAQAARRLSG